MLEGEAHSEEIDSICRQRGEGKQTAPFLDFCFFWNMESGGSRNLDSGAKSVSFLLLLFCLSWESVVVGGYGKRVYWDGWMGWVIGVCFWFVLDASVYLCFGRVGWGVCLWVCVCVCV